MKLLKSLIKALRTRKDSLTSALQADYGSRCTFESTIGEIFLVREEAKNARAHLRDWMEPEDAQISIHLKPARGRIVYQPRGVVAVISAWNYPVQLSLCPMVAAIAAGNRVLIKTSEFTPNAHKAMAELLADIFPPDVVAIVTGGAEVGTALTSLPFDHLFFTGSTRVGRKVMEAAAKNLTPVTLELGGKSPAIIHESFSLKKAAERIVWGKMFNSGQTCIAPDYVMVPTGMSGAFVEAASAAYQKMYPTMKDNADHTAIIHERHFNRLVSLISEAEASGVTMVRAGTEEPDPETRKMPLHLALAPGDDLRMMQEEIFGPILPIIEYDSIDAAIQHVNDQPRPLALYYFDRRGRRAEDMLARTTSGGAAINDCLVQFTQHSLPFGGVGASGIGAYHGITGFQTFSHRKSVVLQSRASVLSLVNPPYGILARWFSKIVMFL
jgi:coniferyl-aldehyde dehydrogenase